MPGGITPTRQTTKHHLKMAVSRFFLTTTGTVFTAYLYMSWLSILTEIMLSVLAGVVGLSHPQEEGIVMSFRAGEVGEDARVLVRCLCQRGSDAIK